MTPFQYNEMKQGQGEPLPLFASASSCFLNVLSKLELIKWDIASVIQQRYHFYIIRILKEILGSVMNLFNDKKKQSENETK